MATNKKAQNRKAATKPRSRVSMQAKTNASRRTFSGSKAFIVVGLVVIVGLITVASSLASSPFSRKSKPLVKGRGYCGGSLPPCFVMKQQSNGYLNLYAGGRTYQTQGRSSASGKWQIRRDDWAKYGGYRNAADAPEVVQDGKARKMWAKGKGCYWWMNKAQCTALGYPWPKPQKK